MVKKSGTSITSKAALMATRFKRSKSKDRGSCDSSPLLDDPLSIEASTWARLTQNASHLPSEGEKMKPPPIVKEVVYNGALARTNLTDFFDDPQFCDVVVNAAGGRRFHCSRLFLCLHSVAFRTTLAFKEGEERKSTINASDVDSDALEQALRFMHMGECRMNEANLVPLIEIAERYKINALGESCRKYQQHSLRLTLDNCCLLLKQAVRSGLFGSDLVTRCERYIGQHMEKLLENDDFLDLSPAAIKGVIGTASNATDAGLLNYSHYGNIVRGLLAWVAKEQEGGRSVSPDELIKLLNIDLLSKSSIQEICSAKVVLDNPKVAVELVKILASKSEVADENSTALVASHEGSKSDVVEKVIERDGWYYVWGVGGMPAVSNVSDPTAEKGVFGSVTGVGGAFYLREGDVLKLALTSDKSDVWTSAVVVMRRRDRAGHIVQPRVLLLAGGFVEKLTWADVDENDAVCLDSMNSNDSATVLSAISLLASKKGSFLPQSAENIHQIPANSGFSGPCLKIWAGDRPPKFALVE